MVPTLLITQVFPPQTGGSGRWFWEIYRRLPREKVVVAAGEHPRQAQFDRTHDLRLVRVPLAMREWGLCSVGGLRGYWRALRPLRRVVRAAGIQRVHCARCIPEGWIARWLKWRYGLPYVCYVHGEDATSARASRELCWMMRQALRGADYVIANSRNTVRILREEWDAPEGRIRLLHPGVDTERFVPAATDQSLRARLGWGRRRVVLTVGRLQKRKGHDRMIRALPAIRQVIPDVLYAIVGDGDERESLTRQVAQARLQGHVQFLGEQGDEVLIQCYQQCDLFVLPNRQVGNDIEGFGMVLLEAQACGKPVLAGASGGTAETMQVPQTGWVMPCEEPESLAEAVVNLLRDETRRWEMGKAARQWVVQHFDWSVLSRQARRLFEGAVAPRDEPAAHAAATFPDACQEPASVCR
ncbi:MAG: glycosyltransferase family 4 protein [Planctomycetes bacterium]|nr:glycosyltransferase family 4 protein [Planctomycetota bacterium]